MLQNINKNQGFTLVELLVAIAIMGAISAISVKLLYDTVSVRSKQYSIENSSDSVRLILSTMSSAIQSAQSISFPSASSIKIIGSAETEGIPCWKFQLTGPKIEQIKDYSDCNNTALSPIPMTPEKVTIDIFSISQTSPITITIKGTYKDSLDPDPEGRKFQYTTSVTNRL